MKPGKDNFSLLRPSRPFVSLLGVVLFAAFLWNGAISANNDPQIPVQYRLKAAFLYNVAKFVEWPEGAFGTGVQTLVIGVMGEPVFANVLRSSLEGKTVQGKTITIRQFSSPADLRFCHILYLDSGVEDQLPTVLKNLGRASVLTVGETERFLEMGGIVNFYIEANRVRFDVNPTNAARSGLKLSSKFLKLARVVSR